MINIKQYAKFVVKLGEKVSPTDIEESMRVGVAPSDYKILLPLPPRVDPSVSMMQVEDKPDVTYDDVGGAKDALEKLREVVELPLLHPERFIALGIDPPKVRSSSLPSVSRNSCCGSSLLTPPPPLPLPFPCRVSCFTALPAQVRHCQRVPSQTEPTLVSFA